MKTFAAAMLILLVLTSFKPHDCALFNDDYIQEVTNKQDPLNRGEQNQINSTHHLLEATSTNIDSLLQLFLMATAHIAQLDDAQLPMLDSTDTSNPFARILRLSESLISSLDDKSIPLGERMQLSLRAMPPIATLLTKYAYALSGGMELSYETAILQGLGFAYTAKMSGLGDQFVKTLDTDDSSYETRLAGLNQLRRGGMTQCTAILLSLTEQEVYHENDRKALAHYLATYGPIFFLTLDPEDQKELILKLNAHISEENNPDVHQTLLDFQKNIN